MTAKSRKRRKSRQSDVGLFISDPTIARALTRFAAQFSYPGRKSTTLVFRRECMAERLLYLALAHIEVMAPLFKQMIEYCDAEGLENQCDYLASLIRVKFQKKLHLVDFGEDDDDDGDGGPSSDEPSPSLPALNSP